MRSKVDGKKSHLLAPRENIAQRYLVAWFVKRGTDDVEFEILSSIKSKRWSFLTTTVNRGRKETSITSFQRVVRSVHSVFQIMSLINYNGAPEEWPFLPVDASFVVRHSYQSTYSHTRSVTAEHDFTDDRVFNHRLCSPFSLKIQFDSLLIQFLFNLLEILHTAVHI